MFLTDRQAPRPRASSRCGAAASVGPANMQVLLGLRHRTNAPLDRVRCELGADHEDSHVAFVMAACGGDHWWWARWDASRREVVRSDVCDGVHQADLDDCLLPFDHTGPHSFEL